MKIKGVIREVGSNQPKLLDRQTDPSNPSDVFPNLFKVQGNWTGTYYIFDNGCRCIDSGQTSMSHKFLDDHPIRYFQSEILCWKDGRVQTYKYTARVSNSELYWIGDEVDGGISETNSGLIITEIKNPSAINPVLRKETICLDRNEDFRKRTIEWRDKRGPIRRAMCKEVRNKKS